VVHHREAGHCEGTGEHAGGERAWPERAFQAGVAQPAGICRQVHRSEERADRDRQASGEDRGGVDPAADQVSCGVADRHPPGRDRADRGAEHVRGEDGGDRERQVDDAPLVRRVRRRLQRVGQPAEHDAQRGDPHRDGQGGRE
jgi:hypothetical protein